MQLQGKLQVGSSRKSVHNYYNLISVGKYMYGSWLMQLVIN